MKWFAAVLSVFLVLAAGDAGAGRDEADATHKRGDYATLLREILSLAEQGDAAAQYNFGVMYAKGQGEPQDYVEAVRWYRSAAEQGLSGALTRSAIRRKAVIPS